MRERIVLVTGATSGIGRAAALNLGRDARGVVVVGRRADRLNALVEEIGADRALAVACDVRDHDALAAALSALPAPFDAVDVVVHSAGLALGLEKADKADLAQWDEMIATNVRALVHLTRDLLPGMVARGRGHVVTIGSVAGTYPYPGGNVYGATKAFVAQFALNLRAELLGTGVRVTNVEPGMVESGFSVTRFSGDETKAKKVYEGMTPLSPDDIADAIRYAVDAPPHVNVNRIELMPTDQAFGPFAVHRNQT